LILLSVIIVIKRFQAQIQFGCNFTFLWIAAVNLAGGGPNSGGGSFAVNY
jgi:hypothetical protein